MKEVIVTGGFGGSGGLGGSCSFWNVLESLRKLKSSQLIDMMTCSANLGKTGWKIENLEKDLVEEVDNGCCEAQVQPRGGELSPSPLHLFQTDCGFMKVHV